MKIALIQMNSGDDRAANLRQATALVGRAVAEERPDWLLLPECFDFLGGTRDAKLAAAELFSGRRGLSHHARPRGASTACSSTRDRCWSACPARSGSATRRSRSTAEGREVARYRKIHLFDITAPDGTEYRESASFKPGDAVVTYDCEGVTVGCSICYDMRFPFLYQALMDRGAELIAVPAAFTLQTGKDHWEVLLRARAIETECYVAAAAQTGTFTQGRRDALDLRPFPAGRPLGPRHGAGQRRRRHRGGTGRARAVEKVRGMIPVARHRVEMPRS